MPVLTAGDDREKSGLQLQIAAIDSLIARLYDLSLGEGETIKAINTDQGGQHD